MVSGEIASAFGRALERIRKRVVVMETSGHRGFPLAVDWPRDEAGHDGMQWEIWWFTTILQAGDRRFAAQALTTHLGEEGVVIVLTIADLDNDREYSVRNLEAPDRVRVSREKLDVEAECCSFNGSFDRGYQLRATLKEGFAFDLVLKPTRPVLYNAGAGTFNLQGTPTFQYSMGALEVSGTVRWEGDDLTVAGHGWHDRQWEALPREGQPEFTWFGISLANGDTLSFWHPVGDDGWVTIARPDGTHVVTAANAVPAATRRTERGRDVPQGWTLTVPALQSRLTISQTRILDDARLYTGAIDVVGTYEAAPSRGHGFCDISAFIDKVDK